MVENVIKYREPDKTTAWREWYEPDDTQTTSTIMASRTPYEFGIKISIAAGYSACSDEITTTTYSV